MAPYAYEAAKRELMDCEIHAFCDSCQKEAYRCCVLGLIETRDCNLKLVEVVKVIRRSFEII